VVLAAVIMKIIVFWHMPPYRLADIIKMLFKPLLPVNEVFKFCDVATSQLSIISNCWAASIIVESGKMNVMLEHESIVVSLML
jgi:hypothetical protein